MTCRHLVRTFNDADDGLFIVSRVRLCVLCGDIFGWFIWSDPELTYLWTPAGE